MAVDLIEIRAQYSGTAEGAKRAGKEAAQSVDAAADKVAAANKRMGDSADAAARKTSESAKRAGMSLDQIGSNLTTKVTLPLTLAGGASVKAAMDFETSFAHIQGLVGVTGAELDKLRQKTLDMAGAEMGKGAQELAEGLYFITSSGLQGEKALDALDRSARASAAGLGTTAQVADAVTSAVAAYAKQGLTAAEATDIMVATVREGKLEADQMASTLGQVIPIASTAGVSLAEVGGAAAILSRNGSDAAESMTQVRSFIDAIIKPSVMATKELEKVGLTTDDLKRSLDEDGLLGTMRLLRDRFGENTEGLAKWAGRIEATKAVLAITNGEAAETDRIFRAVQESTGLTDEAFAAVEKTARHRLNGALAEVQETAINLGGTILPIASSMFSAVGDAAESFAGMDQNAKNAAIAVGAVAAAAGPAMKAVDGITKSWQAFTAMSAGGGVGLAAGGLLAAGAVLWMEHRDNVKKAEEAQRGYTDALREMGDPAQMAIDRLQEMVVEINDSKTAAGEATPELEGLAAAARKIFDAQGMTSTAEKLGTSFQRVVELTRDGTDEFQRLAKFVTEDWKLTGVLDNMTDAQRRFAEEIIAAADAGAISRGEMIGLFKAVDEVADASDDAKESQSAMAKVAIQAGVEAGIVSGHWREQTLAVNGGRDSLDAWIRTAEELDKIRMSENIQTTAEKMLELGVGTHKANDAAEQTPAAMGEAKRSIEEIREEAEKAAEKIDEMREAMLESIDADLRFQNANIDLAESHQGLWQATEDLRVATNTYGEDSKEAAVASYEYDQALQDAKGAALDLAEANVNAAQKQSEANGQTFTARDAQMAYRASIERVRDATGDPNLAAYLDGLLQRIDNQRRATGDLAIHLGDVARKWAAMPTQDQVATAAAMGGGLIPRASGGPVHAGIAYMVGERGPEMFISDYNGLILDSPTTAAVSALASVQARDEKMANLMAAGGTVAQVEETNRLRGTSAPFIVGGPNSGGASVQEIVRNITAAGGTVNADWLASHGLSLLGDNQYGQGLGMPSGGFSRGPATGGRLTVPVPVNIPEIRPEEPSVLAGPLGRFGAFGYPEKLNQVQPATTVVVNVTVDGWANADPKQLGKAAYQALAEEARRRGNSQLRNVLVGLAGV